MIPCVRWAKKCCDPVDGTVYNFVNMHAPKQFMPLRNNRIRPIPRIKGGGRQRPHSGQGLAGNSFFKAGDPVRETGIYEVLHDGSHRTAHEVVMLSGDSFPACDTCETRVKFRIVRTAPYIFQDEDFEEPE